MSKINWKEDEYVLGSYLSNHITVKYLGDNIPRFHVFENTEDGGWVIGEFYTFTGEYVPLEEEGEERLVFKTSSDAQDYIDNNFN